MTSFAHFDPGDRGLDLWLVVTVVVVLTSSAAWLIARLLRGKAALRHLVLYTGLVCCLATPAVAWFCAAAGLTLVRIPLIEAEPHPTSEPAPSVNRVAADPADSPSPRANPAVAPNQGSAASPASVQNPITPTPLAADAELVPAAQGSGTPTTANASSREMVRGLMVLWAAGSVLLLTRLAWNCWLLRRLLRSSRPAGIEHLQTPLRSIADQLGLRRLPELRVSNRAEVPLAVGLSRATIILPQRLIGAVSDDQLRDILVHEMAHLARGDQRVVLLQELAGALYWPILSVYALNRELRCACEELCDNVVLADRDAIRYGETLLRVAELVVNARAPQAAVGMLGGQGQLERRIAGLIDPQRNRTTANSRPTALLVAVLFIAGSLLASATRFATFVTAAESATTAAVQQPSPNSAGQALPAAIGVADAPDAAKLAGHFSGRVTAPDGQPLRGARIFIVPSSPTKSACKPGPVRATTDATAALPSMPPI